MVGTGRTPPSPSRAGRRLTILALLAAPVLAACGSGTASTSAAAPATVTSPTVVTVAPTSSTAAPDTSTTGSSTPPTSTPSPASTAPVGATVVPIAPPDCAASALSVELGPGEGTTSGTVYRPLVFTNSTSSTCRLQGFPGVSHVAGDDGHQVGPPAAWVGSRGDRVDLAPGASAHSIISETGTGSVDPDLCRPTEVRGLRVYPPRSDGAAYVASPGLACRGDVNTLRVRTVTPGRGDLGQGAGVVAPRCTTASLSVGLGPVDGAAGSTYQPIVFTNTGSAVCRIQGFPRVSHVAGDDGHQVGPVAAETGAPGAEIELAPGDSAHAVLRTTGPGAYGDDTCEPTPVRGLRVYPPGEDTAAYVPRPGTSCAGDVVTLRVRSTTSDAD